MLYIGVTSDLSRRLAEHRAGIRSNFASSHRASSLVYFEITSDPRVAIAREKQLKGWKRIRKLALIEAESGVQGVVTLTGIVTLSEAKVGASP